MAQGPADRPATPGQAEASTRKPAPAEDALPETAQPLAGTAQNLQALRTAVVDAAAVGSTLWVSYLFVLLYLFIAAAAVTHKDLFFENGVRLPFLNVDLPLKGFFWLGPLLFIVMHAYVLLHFVLLAGKVGEFDGELRNQIADDDTRTRLRRQLPSNIFVQFLAGPRDVRHGLIGFMLKLIAWISLIIGPVALLVFFQLQFLPYHNEAITWWQRCAVLIDIVLLWALWPAVARSAAIGAAWRGMTRRVALPLAVLSLLPVLLVFTVATFPDVALPTVKFAPVPVPVTGSSETRLDWRLTLPSLHALLVAGPVDQAARRPTSLFSNVLVLPGLDGFDSAKFATAAKFAAVRETIALRGRRLEGAVLIGAKLRKADLTAAQLQGALLDGVDLSEARLGCANRRGDNERRPEDCAQLQAASLVGAQLQGASLDDAQLQGAVLARAQLQGASLDGAQLQGASLNGAQLQGASLDGAQLQGAVLDGARLQGVSLDRAQLQGASLDRAQLQGASLNWARLQGASLDAAQLQGASLDHTQFQGATLVATQLQGASLEGICAWRAHVEPNAGTAGARVVDPRTDAFRPDQPTDDCDWSGERFRKLEALIATSVPAGPRRDAALARIRTQLNPAPPLSADTDMAKVWHGLAENPPLVADFNPARAKAWRDAGCAAEGAPYVMRNLLDTIERRRDVMDRHSPEAWQRTLAGTFLDPATCPAASRLSGRDKTRLIAIRDYVPPDQPPAPTPPR